MNKINQLELEEWVSSHITKQVIRAMRRDAEAMKLSICENYWATGEDQPERRHSVAARINLCDEIEHGDLNELLGEIYGEGPD